MTKSIVARWVLLAVLITGHLHAVDRRDRHTTNSDCPRPTKCLHWKNQTIYERDLRSGRNRRVCSGGTFVLSPTAPLLAVDEVGRDLRLVDLVSKKSTVFKQTRGLECVPIAWSSDGEKLLVSCPSKGAAVLARNESQFKVIADRSEIEPRDFLWPVSWFPSGKSVLLADRSRAFEYSLNGTLLRSWELSSILDSEIFLGRPQFVLSPDAKELLLEVEIEDAKSPVCLLGIDGHNDGCHRTLLGYSLADSAVRNVTPPGFHAYEPRWSPTGNCFSFVGFDERARKAGEWNTYISSRDGSEIQLLTKDLACMPVWDSE